MLLVFFFFFCWLNWTAGSGLVLLWMAGFGWVCAGSRRSRKLPKGVPFQMFGPFYHICLFWLQMPTAQKRIRTNAAACTGAASAPSRVLCASVPQASSWTALAPAAWVRGVDGGLPYSWPGHPLRGRGSEWLISHFQNYVELLDSAQSILSTP